MPFWLKVSGAFKSAIETYMMDQGYLLLATGPERYVNMARNLAASIRVMDPKRRICLVHDENARLDPSDRAYFDDYTVLLTDRRYPGFMNKIRLFPASPYAEAMFVDADCLMMKEDVDTYWNRIRPSGFAINGSRKTTGNWKGAEVAHLLEQEGAPYLVHMNSGVFAFDKSPETSRFFEGLNEFYLRRRDKLEVGLHRGKPAQTDEIYLGLWMGLNGMDGCNSRIGENSWMASTWRAFGLQANPEHGLSLMRKPRRSIAGIPNPLLGWDRISPTFIHFVGLKPHAAYERAVRYFQTKVEMRSTN